MLAILVQQPQKPRSVYNSLDREAKNKVVERFQSHCCYTWTQR